MTLDYLMKFVSSMGNLL